MKWAIHPIIALEFIVAANNANKHRTMSFSYFLEVISRCRCGTM
jgi:hypothetical protein